MIFFFSLAKALEQKCEMRSMRVLHDSLKGCSYWGTRAMFLSILRLGDQELDSDKCKTLSSNTHMRMAYSTATTRPFVFTPIRCEWAHWD